MSQEWNYFQCNHCYVMFPHLATPDICVCGNDLNSNSTRKKFFLSFKIEELKNDLMEGIQEIETRTGKYVLVESSIDIVQEFIDKTFKKTLGEGSQKGNKEKKQ